MHFSALHTFIHDVEQMPDYEISGQIVSVEGLVIEISGPVHMFQIGARLRLLPRNGYKVYAEIIGFRNDRAICMPFGKTDGLSPGTKAVLVGNQDHIRPSNHWLGRVINGLGEPIDGKGVLEWGYKNCALKASPPNAAQRDPVGDPIDLGVRSINSFITCCKGQRLGIFAGSGVGKSYLISMLASNAKCDVAVIGLIGERGREVNEFIHKTLGEEGLKRSIIVVATSDEPPLIRRQAAYMTLALAEYFRDMGQNVLCIMDSVTRVALAQREIGLSAGEPPTTKGYTPSVFTELPKLLERAGPGVNGGSITGLFSVLVDGDNHNEPIADAVRGILDGHIVMDRALAERGQFPAINILKSISRTMPEATHRDYHNSVIEARRLLTAYSDMEELIRLGAYRKGSNKEVDRAIDLMPALTDFLKQEKTETSSLLAGYKQLEEIVMQPMNEAA